MGEEQEWEAFVSDCNPLFISCREPPTFTFDAVEKWMLPCGETAWLVWEKSYESLRDEDLS